MPHTPRAGWDAITWLAFICAFLLLVFAVADQFREALHRTPECPCADPSTCRVVR